MVMTAFFFKVHVDRIRAELSDDTVNVVFLLPRCSSSWSHFDLIIKFYLELMVLFWEYFQFVPVRSYPVCEDSWGHMWNPGTNVRCVPVDGLLFLIYILPLRHVSESRDPNWYRYADDIKIFLSLTRPSDPGQVNNQCLWMNAPKYTCRCQQTNTSQTQGRLRPCHEAIAHISRYFLS